MSKISPKTQEIIDCLKQDESQSIIAATYTWAFGRSNHVSAAFRIAVKQGIIEVAYKSTMGNNVYRRVVA